MINNALQHFKYPASIAATAMATTYVNNKYHAARSSQPEVLTKGLGEAIERDPTSALRLIVNAVPGTTPNQRAVSDALVVRLSDRMDMRGATFHDAVSPEVKQGNLRAKVSATVYPWTAAGVSCVPLYTVKGERYALMGHNKRRDGDKPNWLLGTIGFSYPT